MISRRIFMKNGGLALVSLGFAPTFLARTVAAAESRRRVLITIFQRGAVDGLNMIVPFGERDYYAARPTLAIAKPGASADAAIDLDGFFGLHPRLSPLKPLFDARQMAVVHACGSPDGTRSHFDAQDYMELGTPGIKATPDGWLNRLLAEEKTANPLRAVALTQRLPRILVGPAPALTLTSVEEFRLRDPLMAPALQKLYANVKDPMLRRGGENLFEAVRILKSVETRLPPASEGYPNGRFGTSLNQISRLIKANLGLEIAFAEIEGWDTHVNQGGATGQMANRLKDLADGLAAFHRDLGDRFDDVVLLTLSEFGRTARENGNRGTDHGHANVMFVMGGKIKGGKVYGRWPGLDPAALYEGRDLSLTTDFRMVCCEILSRHLGQKDLKKVFPAFDFSTGPIGVVA
jgi:uncharacterized protein (DUF1501 family)